METNIQKTVAVATMESFDNRPPNTVGSSRIRARWLLPYWEEAEEYQIGQKYQTIIYQKVYWKEMLKQFDGIQIMDLCDPDWLEKKPVFEFIDLADAVVTSSPALRDYIQKLRPEKKVVCIPDRIYLPEHQPVKTKHEGLGKKAVWFGYSHNTHYLTKTLEQLILNGIELTVISNEPYQPPYAYKALKLKNVPYDYSTIHKELIKADWVLMPQPTEDEKGQFKSDNKTLTAWALGMPVVTLPEQLTLFVNDPKAREEESKKRLQEIKDKHDVRISVEEYRKLITELKENKYGRK